MEGVLLTVVGEAEGGNFLFLTVGFLWRGDTFNKEVSTRTQPK